METKKAEAHLEIVEKEIVALTLKFNSVEGKVSSLR